MIYGIGVDIVEMERIAEIIQHNFSFVQKVLTVHELDKFTSLKGIRQVEFLAGRFACKEAFSKAYGTGFGKLGLQDIEILADELGKPVITKSPFNEGIAHVSISHTAQFAVAQVILETDT